MEMRLRNEEDVMGMECASFVCTIILLLPGGCAIKLNYVWIDRVKIRKGACGWQKSIKHICSPTACRLEFVVSWSIGVMRVASWRVVLDARAMAWVRWGCAASWLAMNRNKTKQKNTNYIESWKFWFPSFHNKIQTIKAVIMHCIIDVRYLPRETSQNEVMSVAKETVNVWRPNLGM